VLVEAALIDGVSREEVGKTESAWRLFLTESLQEYPALPRMEYSHWDWRRKHETVQGLIAYRMFGVECAGDMQGLVLVSTAGHPCRIKEQKAKEQVYVDFIATAPWNSSGLVQAGRFGLVGRVLIATAVQLSVAEGFKGRMGLHALPQAETFYARNCGMTDLGKDKRKEGLRYFEMTPKQAAAFLQ
jgi:hypothetical protein